MNYTYPACFFPTKLFWVDDDVDYLSMIDETFPQDTYTYTLFDNPKKCLQYINDFYTPPSGILNQDSSRIHDIVFNQDRFSLCSVVVCDYHMPQMTGVELAQQIRPAHPLKRILLTNETDQELRFEALNSDSVDRYLHKAKVTGNSFAQTVRELQISFFNNLFPSPLPFLKDEDWCLDFEKLLRQNNIIEYYYVAEEECFVLLNEFGKIQCYFVRTSEEVRCEQDNISKDKMPQKLCNKLLSSEYIFCNAVSVSEVEDPAYFVYPAHKVQSKADTYYCALTPDLINFQRHNIAPYISVKKNKLMF